MSTRASRAPGGGFEYAAALAPLVNLRMFRWNPYVRAHAPAPGWDLLHFDEPYDDPPPEPSIRSLEPDPWKVEWERYGEHCMAPEARMLAAMLPALEHVFWVASQEEYAVDSLCCIARANGCIQVQT
jgi:hypothetical protein